MREVYSPKIIETVYKFCKDAIDRKLISENDLEEIRADIETSPYGQAGILYELDSRDIYIKIYWYALRRTKYADWTFGLQDNILNKKDGAVFVYSHNRRDSWQAVFPDRARDLSDIIFRRRMAKDKVYPPKDIKITAVRDSEYGIYYVEDTEGWYYLCSPAGCIRLSERYVTDVVTSLKSIGLKLPRKTEGLTWEDIEPMWVMAVLKN